jgi:murein DD-endopeptidase MepM/ murein hydrolase activator NlpD
MAFRPPALLLLVLGVLAPATARADSPSSGGTAAPEASGGVNAGQPFPRRPRPRIAAFAVTPARIRTTGGRLTFAYRVDAATPTVRAQIVLTPRGARRPVARLRLGAVPVGSDRSYAWRVPARRLPAGTYSATLAAVDAAGRRARRTPGTPGRARLTVLRARRPTPSAPAPPAPAPAVPVAAPTPVAAPATAAGVFPVQGAWTFGGDASRFGAPRTGHMHQGQDISAAAGTPVVAPETGVIQWVAYQASGAGYYVVLRCVSGRDMVFMHLEDGSIAVAQGALVTAGQLLARVGATGTASGPHLHFELWPNGWRTTPQSQPIDPVPDLIAWANTR